MCEILTLASDHKIPIANSDLLTRTRPRLFQLLVNTCFSRCTLNRKCRDSKLKDKLFVPMSDHPSLNFQIFIKPKHPKLASGPVLAGQQAAGVRAVEDEHCGLMDIMLCPLRPDLRLVEIITQYYDSIRTREPVMRVKW